MTPSTKIRVGLLLLLCILALALCPRPALADELYQPVAADFQPIYDRDSADKNYQSWDGHDSYWYWVQIFYRGYTKRALGVKVVRQAGWTATSQSLVSHLGSEPARHALTVALNTLGRDVAGEWAKNYHVCRINTHDLSRWHDIIAQASSRDSGNGQVVLAAVRGIQAEVDTRLKGRP